MSSWKSASRRSRSRRGPPRRSSRASTLVVDRAAGRASVSAREGRGRSQRVAGPPPRSRRARRHPGERGLVPAAQHPLLGWNQARWPSSQSSGLTIARRRADQELLVRQVLDQPERAPTAILQPPGPQQAGAGGRRAEPGPAGRQGVGRPGCLRRIWLHRTLGPGESGLQIADCSIAPRETQRHSQSTKPVPEEDNSSSALPSSLSLCVSVVNALLFSGSPGPSDIYTLSGTTKPLAVLAASASTFASLSSTERLRLRVRSSASGRGCTSPRRP